jgi:hypothetical protein
LVRVDRDYRIWSWLDWSEYGGCMGLKHTTRSDDEAGIYTATTGLEYASWLMPVQISPGTDRTGLTNHGAPNIDFHVLLK